MSATSQRDSKRPVPVSMFLLLALGLTWLFWIPAVFLSRLQTAVPAMLLHYIGGAMPFVLAVILVQRTWPKHERRQYWQRVIDFRRIKPSWYAVIVLLIPVLTGLGALLDVLTGGVGLTLTFSRFAGQWLSFVSFGVFLLVFGPIPEELAWRGYAQGRLQTKLNPFWAAVTIGAFWALWHLPLFFIQGSYQNGLGVGTMPFWLFMADKIPQSLMMAWLYNRTRGSILSAVLFHYIVNLTGELSDLALRAEVIYMVLLWLAALLICVIWRSDLFGQVRPLEDSADAA